MPALAQPRASQPARSPARLAGGATRGQPPRAPRSRSRTPRWSALASLALALACARPPGVSEAPAGPTRLPILDPDYGRDAEHPEALAIGDELGPLALTLADGGALELDAALAAGPVILIWIGGAEHQALSAWVQGLDGGLAELDERAATLVWVRSLPADAALRWAAALRLQTPVAIDDGGELAAALDLEPETAQLEHAVVIVDAGRVAYRKLGGRRPKLDELLAVLDDEAEGLRCCPDPCPDPQPCLR